MRGKALIIDDDSAVRFLLFRVLREAGFTPISFTTAESAFGWIAQHGAPSLVICDLNLPRMSGITACSLLRKLDATRQTPIIVITSRVDARDAVCVRDLGAAYLNKPFRIRELMRKVDEVAGENAEHAATLPS